MKNLAKQLQEAHQFNKRSEAVQSAVLVVEAARDRLKSAEELLKKSESIVEANRADASLSEGALSSFINAQRKVEFLKSEIVGLAKKVEDLEVAACGPLSALARELSLAVSTVIEAEEMAFTVRVARSEKNPAFEGESNLRRAASQVILRDLWDLYRWVDALPAQASFGQAAVLLEATTQILRRAEA